MGSIEFGQSRSVALIVVNTAGECIFVDEDRGVVGGVLCATCELVMHVIRPKMGEGSILSCPACNLRLIVPANVVSSGRRIAEYFGSPTAYRENFKSRFGICGRCFGKKMLQEVESDPDEPGRVRYKAGMAPCPQCRGSGRASA